MTKKWVHPIQPRSKSMTWEINLQRSHNGGTFFSPTVEKGTIK
jgi:hypothetical protein